jgi:deoxyribodipyrimidine photolyase
MALHWFRKGLRIHDNPALLDACSRGRTVFPVFILDPHFSSQTIGANRYQFLLQSLDCLDKNLRNIGSRLYIAKGKPEDCLPFLFREWNIEYLTFEKDSEPYALHRDAVITNLAKKSGINVMIHNSHTLRDLEAYHGATNDITKTYASFISHFHSLGPPTLPVGAPAWVSSNTHQYFHFSSIITYILYNFCDIVDRREGPVFARCLSSRSVRAVIHTLTHSASNGIFTARNTTTLVSRGRRRRAPSIA